MNCGCATGDLSPAISASYALPGIFRPVRINGHWLIDGGVVNPVPVAACRALGARMVIAVNLGPESASGIAIQNPPDIARRPGRWQYGAERSPPCWSPPSTSPKTGCRARASPAIRPISALTPRTPGLGLFDFDKAEEAIAAGRDAVDRAMHDIERACSRLV